MTKWCILRPGKIRVLKRADLASWEAATARCPSKRRYLNVPTTSPAVRRKRAPASTGWGLSLLIVHPEGYRYGPISRGDSRRGRSGARLFSARFLRPMVPWRASDIPRSRCSGPASVSGGSVRGKRFGARAEAGNLMRTIWHCQAERPPGPKEAPGMPGPSFWEETRRELSP